MRRAAKAIWRHVPDMVFLLCVCVLFCIVLGGCAAGRNDATGEIVVGWGVAKLTETANQGLAQLGDMVLPGAGAALAAIGVPVIAWARAKSAAAAAQAAHAAENKGFDEGNARAAGAVVPVPPVVASAPSSPTT